MTHFLQHLTKRKGTVTVDSTACTLCATCAAVCPKRALTVTTNWSINDDACVRCARCIRNCPQKALKMVKTPH
jgi:ferredoxin